MKNKLIIFGAGKIAEAVSYYFERDSDYVIEAYVVDPEFATNDSFLSKPLVGLDSVIQEYPAADYTVFVATGYQGINQLRTDKYNYFKENVYSFTS